MNAASALTILEIVKADSLAGTASELNISQTAVNAQLRSLETQLNCSWFVRNKVEVEHTAPKGYFLTFITAMVQIWDRARQSVALPPGHDNVFNVGAECSPSRRVHRRRGDRLRTARTRLNPSYWGERLFSR